MIFDFYFTFRKCLTEFKYTLKTFDDFKNFPSDKTNGTKNALFFLSRAPTHRSFTFNL